MKWLKENPVVIFCIIASIIFIGALVGSVSDTSTYLLIDPTEEQIKALYAGDIPGYDLSLNYVTGASALVEMKISYKWYYGDAIREYLESNRYNFIER